MNDNLKIITTKERDDRMEAAITVKETHTV